MWPLVACLRADATEASLGTLRTASCADPALLLPWSTSVLGESLPSLSPSLSPSLGTRPGSLAGCLQLPEFFCAVVRCVTPWLQAQQVLYGEDRDTARTSVPAKAGQRGSWASPWGSSGWHRPQGPGYEPRGQRVEGSPPCCVPAACLGPAPVNAPALLCHSSVPGLAQASRRMGGPDPGAKKPFSPLVLGALFFQMEHSGLLSWSSLQGQGGAPPAAQPAHQERLVGHSWGPSAHVLVSEPRVHPTRHTFQNFSV